MNESKNKRAVMVGLFLFVGLLFLIGGILMVGNLNETFKRKMKVVSLFDDVGGLQPGNNVWFSGVKIGTVSKIQFYGRSQVVVSMRIDARDKQYIRKDSKVKIGADGLIGNKILVIYGGTFRVPEVEEGDTLSVEKTFTSDDMINTLQANNENVLAITKDFKVISKRMANGEGTIGSLLNDKSVYDNIKAATFSLQNASAKAQKMMASLEQFSSGLNKEGTLANNLVTDTVVFNSLKASVLNLQLLTDTASVFIADLKEAASNTKTPVGIMLHDEEAGAHLKEMIKNLDSSSKKLEEDLEAAQHSFLLRGYFKKQDKAARKDSLMKK